MMDIPDSTCEDQNGKLEIHPVNGFKQCSMETVPQKGVLMPSNSVSWKLYSHKGVLQEELKLVSWRLREREINCLENPEKCFLPFQDWDLHLLHFLASSAP